MMVPIGDGHSRCHGGRDVHVWVGSPVQSILQEAKVSPPNCSPASLDGILGDGKATRALVETPRPARAVTLPLPPQGTDLRTTSGAIPTVGLCLQLLRSEVRRWGWRTPRHRGMGMGTGQEMAA